MMRSIIGSDLVVGARASPLSQAQIYEVEHALRLQFKWLLIETTGDSDRATSLREMEKNNFFTKEIDNALLEGRCRVAVHSAKDLPEPLPKGVKLVALTKGLNPADALVMRPGESVDTLPRGAVIATSSIRREQEVMKLRRDCRFRDLRGTIAERLALLERGEADGVVVAEAALIRLGLTHLNRVQLDGQTAAYQGQLAILARKGDCEMEDLFAPIDGRWRLLWTGLEPLQDSLEKKVMHLPLIRVQPLPFSNADIQAAFQQFNCFTDLILTSKTAVDLLRKALIHFSLSPSVLSDRHVFAVGDATAKCAAKIGCSEITVAQQACSEGVIEELAKAKWSGQQILWPHSAQSRPLIGNWLTERAISWRECLLYETVPNLSIDAIDFDKIDEIVFTSPSTVHAFVQLFGALPNDKRLTPIGPVTEASLNLVLERCNCSQEKIT